MNKKEIIGTKNINICGRLIKVSLLIKEVTDANGNEHTRLFTSSKIYAKEVGSFEEQNKSLLKQIGKLKAQLGDYKIIFNEKKEVKK